MTELKKKKRLVYRFLEAAELVVFYTASWMCFGSVFI